MLSNKLTFSLASLVVICVMGLALSVTPASGQATPSVMSVTIPAGTDADTFVIVQAAGPSDQAPGTSDQYDDNNFISISVSRRAGSPWVDLEDFFINGGGTIELIGPASTLTNGAIPAANERDKGDVVISEIMWGSNLAPSTDNNFSQTRTSSQWIELYVREEIASDETWNLKFTRNKLVSNTFGGQVLVNDGGNNSGNNPNLTDDTYGDLVDVVSNWGLGYWPIAEDGSYGQSGNEASGSGATAIAAKTRISMYRNIDYAKVNADTDPADGVDGLPDGTRSGSWKESAPPRGANQGGYVFASPGEEHFTGLISAGDTTSVARDGVVFNEIANRTANAQDWIELYNKKAEATRINGWALSVVTNNSTETRLFEFKSDNDIMVPGMGYLLVVATDPSSTSLAVGSNVDDVTPGRGAKTTYYVNSGLALGNNQLLMLRSGTDKDKTHEKIVDVAAIGAAFFAKLDADYNTDVWPLKSTAAGAKGDNIANDSKTWVRDQGKALFHGDAWKSDGGVTGVGVDRNATAYNSGTPGYANGALQSEFFDVSGKAKFTGSITISEIMVDQTRRNLPQWIELYNASTTQGVNLKGWELMLLNVRSTDLDIRSDAKLNIDGDFRIGPNQTALIVSGAGRKSDDIPTANIYNLYNKHRRTLEMTSQRDSVLSLEGFYISLSDGRGNPADAVGNIDSDKRTDDVPAWTLPMGEANDERSSLIRRYVSGSAEDGMAAAAWILAAETNISVQTYYGDSGDIGSPAYRTGSALPVSLSSFRPERNKATGEIVVRWVTQSELNNAGFNILRSETKTGEFKVVNLKGIIPGHGTTSEKHVYTWTDTSAKPNVVYYYQIEDVSLEGQRTTLATTHLRGNVNAAGKLTTTWGDLKTQD